MKKTRTRLWLVFSNSNFSCKTTKHTDQETNAIYGRSRANFPVDGLFKFLPRSDNELLVSEMQTKMDVTDFVSEIKCAENYPNFENVIQHSLQGFIVKNVEGESTGPNDLSHIL